MDSKEARPSGSKHLTSNYFEGAIMSTDTQAGLLNRFIHTHDTEAFAVITRQYAGMVYGTCIRITGNQERAADAAQETFFHLAKHARQVSGSLAGWLHRVAVGKSVNLVRSDVARRRREAEYAAQPKDSDDWSDISPLVDEALQELEEHHREILVRHFLQGETLTELAAANGVSQPTMSRRSEAALEQLRLQLKSKGVVVAALSFGGLIANAATSAPAAVISELGKMALATSSATTAGTTTFLGVNMKLVVAAAIAVTGTGGFLAYKATRPVTPLPPALVASQQVIAQSSPKQPGSTEAIQPAPSVTTPPRSGSPADTSRVAPSGGAPVPMLMRGRGDQPGGMGFGGFGAAGGGMSYAGGLSTAVGPSGPLVTKATTDGALNLFADALMHEDVYRFDEFFANQADAEAFRGIWDNPTNDVQRRLQQVYKSVGPKIEISQSAETAEGLQVTWKAMVLQPFTLNENGEVKSWSRGDRFEFETRMKKIGGEWKIVGL